MPHERAITVQGAPAAPWWTGLLVAYQPKGAASLAASYANLGTAGAANNAAPGSAPTWNATDGWICDGSAWLTPGTLNLGTVHTVAIASIPASQEGVYNFGPMVGRNDASGIAPAYVGGLLADTIGYTEANSTVTAAVPSMLGAVHTIITVRNGTSVLVYLDGAPRSTTGTIANTAADGLLLLSRTMAYKYRGTIRAMGAVGSVLDAAQVAALHAAMAAL
jgi:hypothetical protein